MGSVMGTLKTRNLNMQADESPTFEPAKGFERKRPKRVSKAVEAELISARIPPQFRDYCAQQLLDYQVCRYKVMPLLYQCHHERHAYLECEHQDYVLRMKEFERERRLREREIRVKTACPA